MGDEVHIRPLCAATDAVRVATPPSPPDELEELLLREVRVAFGR